METFQSAEISALILCYLQISGPFGQM